MMPNLNSTISWLEGHPSTTTLIALAVTVLTPLFNPSAWRKLVASILAGSIGFFMLPYNPGGRLEWAARAIFLAFVFVCAYRWLLGKFQAWTAKRRLQTVQPSGTFEAVAETAIDVVSQSHDSTVSVNYTDGKNTLVIKKVPSQKK